MQIPDGMLDRVEQFHSSLCREIDECNGLREWMTKTARNELEGMVVGERPPTLQPRPKNLDEPGIPDGIPWVVEHGKWQSFDGGKMRRDREWEAEAQYPLGRSALLLVVCHNHPRLSSGRELIWPVERDSAEWYYFFLFSREETWPTVNTPEFELLKRALADSLKAFAAERQEGETTDSEDAERDITDAAIGQSHPTRHPTSAQETKKKPKKPRTHNKHTLACMRQYKKIRKTDPSETMKSVVLWYVDENSTDEERLSFDSIYRVLNDHSAEWSDKSPT